MQKRVISFLLSAAVLLGLFCGMVPSVSAASNMKASDACVDMIKEMEGFSKYPYEDNGQYTVGYGTACPEEDLERYLNNGITEEEAEELLREYISDFESSLNSFISKNSLSLNQNQFDGLLSFTYNVGSNWMNSESTFRTAVLSGATGNDFIFAIARWCTASGKVLEALIQRRLIEANMYLNGVYKNAVPSNYKYVIFDDNLEGAVNDVRVQGFDTNTPDNIRSTPTASGYTFLGWYTMASGGTQVTVLDSSISVTTLYAHWQSNDGSVTETETPIASGVVTTEKLNVRSGPSTNESIVGYLYTGDEVEIYETTTVDGVTWGRTVDGWINLEYVELTDKDDNSGAETVVARGVVIAEKLNVRSGPSTNESVVGYLYAGDEVEIYETTKVDGVTWGRTADGWISMEYVELKVEGETPETETVIARGVVTTEKLNVRGGAGTEYIIVGYLYAGDEVEIYETTTVNGVTWGRVAEGWISLEYVKLTDEVPETETVIARGVVTTEKLNVRSGPGTSNSLVAYLYEGDTVEIYETTKVNGVTWGRVAEGWISLDYIQYILEAPELTVTNVASTGKVKLTWNEVMGAESYQVYRSTKKSSGYSLRKTTSSTSFTNTAAEAGTTYYYYVMAVAPDGTVSDASNMVQRTCDLARPTITLSNVASSGKIKITWEAVESAVGYEVYRATSKNETYTLLETVTGTKLTDTSAEAGKTYYYKVKAIAEKSAANSVYSSAKYRTCDLAQPEVTVKNVASTGKIRISWEAVDGAVSYEVYRATSKNGDYTLRKTVTGTSFTNTSAVAGKTYYYKVKAIAEKSAANSAYSAIAARTCDLPRPEVTIELNSNGKPRVTWKAVDGAVSYEIYRATSQDGEYKLMCTATSTRYTNTSAKSGTTYYYRIVAVAEKTAANSAKSTVVSITAK